MNHILEVRESSVHGEGLFAKIDLNDGQKIIEIQGDVIDVDECVRREDEGNVYIFWKDDDIYIDTSNSDKIKYINHSCNFNCDVVEVSEKLILTAAKNISAGEELTIDYGYEEIYQYCSCSSCDNKPNINNSK
jgi:SET domain-containing protein